MQSEISCKNTVKNNVQYIACELPTYLFVAGSIIWCSVCQWFTKLGLIVGMRRFEDYSFWRRYLPLVSCMTKTLCRIIEKEISSLVNCCRKVQLEIKLLNITHTWCSSVFARSLNKAIRQKPRITQHELRKNLHQISRS